VGVEDAGFLGVEGLADLVLDVLDLLAREDEGLLESLDLLGEIGFGNVVMRDVSLSLVEDEDLALAYSGGNRNTLVNHLGSLGLIGHEEHLTPTRLKAKQIVDAEKISPPGGRVGYDDSMIRPEDVVGEE
jgi:hypothetical protein